MPSTTDRDELDEALDTLDHRTDPDREGEGDWDATLDRLDLLRRRLRHTERQRRRRLRRQTKARSGVTANVHLDLASLAGRGLDDVADIEAAVLRGEGWAVTEQAARRLLCDSALVATLFAGPSRVLDAKPANEQFTRAQRRALAARDRGCVFPACTRPPRWCDAHHLHPRGRGGPSVVGNGALFVSLPSPPRARIRLDPVHRRQRALGRHRRPRHHLDRTGRALTDPRSGTGPPRPPDRPAHQHDG